MDYFNLHLIWLFIAGFFTLNSFNLSYKASDINYLDFYHPKDKKSSRTNIRNCQDLKVLCTSRTMSIDLLCPGLCSTPKELELSPAINCAHTRFGCCSDGKTIALAPIHSGHSKCPCIDTISEPIVCKHIMQTHSCNSRIISSFVRKHCMSTCGYCIQPTPSTTIIIDSVYQDEYLSTTSTINKLNNKNQFYQIFRRSEQHSYGGNNYDSKIKTNEQTNIIHPKPNYISSE